MCTCTYMCVSTKNLVDQSVNTRTSSASQSRKYLFSEKVMLLTAAAAANDFPFLHRRDLAWDCLDAAAAAAASSAYNHSRLERRTF